MTWCMDCKKHDCRCGPLTEAEEQARRKRLKALLAALAPHLTSWAQNHPEALLNDIRTFLKEPPPMFLAELRPTPDDATPAGFYAFQSTAKAIMEHLNRNREAIIAAFIASTGCSPEDAEIVEQHGRMGTRWWVQKRGEPMTAWKPGPPLDRPPLEPSAPHGLTPIVYDAGQDRRLFEANGWDWEKRGMPGLNHGDITIERRTREGHADHWAVCSRGMAALERMEGGVIAFCCGDWAGEPCPTLEAAKALLDEYLSQPINPYLWVREGDKPCTEP